MLCLLAILVIAAVARFIFIGSGEASFDELWHLELSTGRGSAHETLPMNIIIADTPALTSLAGAPPWYQISGSLDTVTHPPLFPILLRAWRSMCGESIAAGRAMSAMISVSCVLALFLAARLLHGPVTAMWAALLLSVSSAQIDIGQEVRNYTLLMLCCLCAAAAMLSIERHGLSIIRVSAMSVALLAALFTHYFAAPAVGAMCIYALWRLHGRDRWTVLGVVVGAYLVFAAGWGPMVARQSQAFAGAMTPGALLEPGEQHVQRTISRLAVLPVRLLFEPRKHMAGPAMLGAVVFVLPFLLLRQRPQLLLWTLWFVCVIGFAAAMDFTRSTRHLEQIRHTILAGPALCVILAGMMQGAGRVLSNSLPALIAAACAAALGLTYTRDNVRFSEIGRLLGDSRHANEPVVFYSDSGMVWWSQWLFLGAAHYSGTFPRPTVRLDRPAPQHLLRELRHWPRIWLVWGATRLRSDQIVPGTEVVSIGGEPYLGLVAQLRWCNGDVSEAPGTDPGTGQ